MFVYDIGIVDFFQGMTKLSDYIKLCDDADECFYHSPHSLKRLLIKFFMSIKSHQTYWEGDIRHDNIAISAVPRQTGDYPKVFICFKQDNNGHSFLISESQFHFTKEDMDFGDITLITKLNSLTSEILIRYFDQSYKLVEDIFDKAKNKNKSSKDDLIEIEQRKIVEEVKRENIIKNNDDNKFDKSNYIQL